MMHAWEMTEREGEREDMREESWSRERVGRETREKADERERCNGLEAHVLKILK